MAIERIEHQASYILNRRNYQESSLIVDVFSLQFGRISLVAKGALRSKKNWSALLQAFQPLLLSWSGRSTLKTLTMVEAPSKPLSLKSERLYCAYYLNELVLKLLPEQETNSGIFASYVQALQSLEDNNKLEVILRLFEYDLLKQLGLAPDFFRDIDGIDIIEENLYSLIPSHGFDKLSLDSSEGEDGSHILVLDGLTLLKLYSGAFQNETDFLSMASRARFFRQAKALMRVLVDQALLGFL